MSRIACLTPSGVPVPATKRTLTALIVSIVAGHGTVGTIQPMKVGVALADVCAGKDAAVAILACLAGRERLGPADRMLTISLAHSATAALVNVAQNALVTGREPVRWGNAHPNLVPYQLFEAEDRPFILAVGNDAQWLACCEAIGRSDLAADPRYLDISVPPRTRRSLPVESSRHAFAYVFAGSGTFRDASEPLAVRNELKGGEYDLGNRSLVLFDSGDEIVVESGDEGIRFLLVSGRPIEEPVAWYGPIVMNTQAELRQAMRELQLGTFIR